MRNDAGLRDDFGCCGLAVAPSEQLLKRRSDGEESKVG